MCSTRSNESVIRFSSKKKALWDSQGEELENKQHDMKELIVMRRLLQDTQALWSR